MPDAYVTSSTVMDVSQLPLMEMLPPYSSTAALRSVPKFSALTEEAYCTGRQTSQELNSLSFSCR